MCTQNPTLGQKGAGDSIEPFLQIYSEHRLSVMKEGDKKELGEELHGELSRKDRRSLPTWLEPNSTRKNAAKNVPTGKP